MCCLLRGGHFITVHIRIFDAFFSSLAHSSVFLVPFRILRAVPYSSKGFWVCALNSAQFLASILRSACMRCNGTKGTATYAIEKVQNGRTDFAAAIYGTNKPFCGRSQGYVVQTAAGQQWKTTAPNAGLGVSKCDSTGLTDAHRYARDRFCLLMQLLRVHSND